MDELDGFTRTTGRAAIAGGALGLAAMVTVFAVEAQAGGGMMSTAGATAAGWSSFAAACLLMVGLVGLAVRHANGLSRAGRAALLVLCLATAVTVGATSTLALVVPDLIDRVPEIVNEPPAAVPPTFILSGLVSGVAAIVVAVTLRRAGHGGLGTSLLLAGAVATMVPLPSRFFLLSFAVGALLLAPQPARDEVDRDLARTR